MKESSNITNSLAHTKWNCKYHIVFAPNYRRKVFYEEHRLEVRETLRKLCEWKGVEIIEGEVCPDHIHILVSIPPKMSVSVFMGYLKGKSATIIVQRWGNMKFAYRNREFWCKGYYVDTVGKNTKAIQEYVANQLKADREADQLSIFDPRDPLTGSKEYEHEQVKQRAPLCYAYKRGLCPKKNHVLCTWMMIGGRDRARTYDLYHVKVAL